jgi:hypothetical protein
MNRYKNENGILWAVPGLVLSKDPGPGKTADRFFINSPPSCILASFQIRYQFRCARSTLSLIMIRVMEIKTINVEKA